MTDKAIPYKYVICCANCGSNRFINRFGFCFAVFEICTFSYIIAKFGLLSVAYWEIAARSAYDMFT